MRELSLFTGAGGGLLGTKLLGWKHCGYVEINDYCQRVIAQRIKDGMLDEAPIFGDIRSFISEGYAASYQGMVDVVTGGFPCQPFSITGKGLGIDDPRNMWPETIEVIRQIQPRFALLENVPNLTSHEYCRTIFRDLAASGYSTRWDILGAADIGGVHIGNRLWMVASSNKINGAANGKVHTKTNYKQQVWGRNSWPSIQDAEKAWLLSNSFIVPEDHGMAPYVDEFEAIGNGQFPPMVKTVWELMS